MLMESFSRGNLSEFELYLSGLPDSDLRKALRRVENDCQALLLGILRRLQQGYLNSISCQSGPQFRAAPTQLID